MCGAHQDEHDNHQGHHRSGHQREGVQRHVGLMDGLQHPCPKASQTKRQSEEQGVVNAPYDHARPVSASHSDIEAMGEEADPDEPCSEVKVDER